MVYKIGWFSTGRGKGSLNLLNAIVKAIQTGQIKAEISFVFCNREPGEAEGSDRYIKQVKDYGLKLVCFSSRSFNPDLKNKARQDPSLLRQWRIEYDREIMKRISCFESDINVLAGYMLIVGEEMCKEYDMINLHPAPPGGPTGTWRQVIWELILKRASIAGNMMHLVTEELDKGPPITYSTFSLRGKLFDPLWEDLENKLKKSSFEEIKKKEAENNLLFKTIREESAKREIPLVIQTVKAFAEGKIRLDNRRIIVNGRVLDEPYCLNKEVEMCISEI